MVTNNEQLQDLSEIRSIMERSTRFISLSGLSGIFAGTFALAGVAVAYLYLGYGDLAYEEGIRPLPDISNTSFMWYLLIDALAVLILSLGTSLYFSKRKASRNGIPFWDNSARRLLINMFIPLFTGGILCLILFFEREVFLVIALTLIFYGLALFSAGKYTLDEVRYLGIGEIVCGIFAAGLPKFGLIFWATGFGLFHIIYGVVMYNKYDR